MKRAFFTSLVSLAAIVTSSSAFASSWLKSGSGAKTPMGHHEYCQRGGRHCGAQSATAPAKMTGSKWKKVQSINARVNAAIKPASDMQTRGVNEYWEIPKSQGDCEDYAMLKRSKLLSAGFKPSQLPLVKARLRNGEAHVVLVLRTDEGDFALDNLTTSVKPVNQSGLRYLAMQSPTNASKWLSITGYKKKP